MTDSTTTREFSFDVFLSHRTQDKDRVRRIAEGLRNSGMRVWFDEWVIRPGDDIYLSIEKGLEGSRTLVLCLSSSALQSGWVDLERSTALFRDPTNTDRRFVPLLLEDAPLPDTLRRYRYIDYRRDDQTAFEELLAACKGTAVSISRPPSRASESPKRATDEKLQGARPKPRAGRIASFAALALGAFVAALGVLLTMIYQAEALVRLGLVGNLYYVALVPLGLSVGAFLFGALRSHAAYTGRHGHGTLELGGPVVSFVLVLVLGFALVPGPETFAVTIFVHGETGRQDIALREGALLLDLAGDRRREAIGDKGQAYFPGIPSSFRGQTVGGMLESPGFELPKESTTITLDRNYAYIAVRPRRFEVSGYVTGVTGNPVVGATVSLAGESTSTDKSGYFKLPLPATVGKASVTMQVAAQGHATWRGDVVPGEVAVQLQKAD